LGCIEARVSGRSKTLKTTEHERSLIGTLLKVKHLKNSSEMFGDIAGNATETAE
jgi:hypothetical protein